MRLVWLLALIASLSGALPRTALAGVVSETVITDNVMARLVAESEQVTPGGAVDLALLLDIRPHWHTYWRNPGDSGEPPHIQWHLPEGVEAGPIRWPLPELIRVGPLANYGYSGRATHLVELRMPQQWPVGTPVSISADVTWLVCEEECVPEQGSFALSLDTAPDVPADEQSEVNGPIADARAALPLPGTLPARLDRTDGMRLQVPVASLPSGVTDAQFFAGSWGLIDHAAPQRWRLEDDALVLDLAPGETPGAVPAAGLLVVETADGRVGFEVDAGISGDALQAVAGTSVEYVVRGDSSTEWVSVAGGGAEPASAAALGLPLALLFALLGGLALNLMPCVFPVLAIKALGLARQAGAPVHERLLHALAYGSGVLLFFALTALLLLTLRASGAAVGWGFQLQSPVFVAFMAYLFLVLGLSLAGAVTIGTRLMGIGASAGLGGSLPGEGGVADSERRHLGAFVTGALAALVAAPCTAPFMGAALGYAATLPWLPALSIMLMLGVGMALPFMLLALVPRLNARLPRPGPWMEHLKQLLAFPMFATAAWLIWVLSVQIGPAGVGAVLTGMLALSLALWLLERTRNSTGAWRWVGVGSAVLGLAGAFWLGATMARFDAPALATGVVASGVGASGAEAGSDSALSSKPYSAQALADARAAGRPVFVNMTAAWCITCLVNERVALSGGAIGRAFAERDILYLKGDWTNRDPNITEYLAGFGRNGVPIYVFYPTHGQPRVLPQILTESMVLAALDDA